MNGFIEHKPSILVADDSISVLRLIVEILTRQGYTVRPAIDGEAALSSIRAEVPDLILLDARMPKMDGYEVCRQLKAEGLISSIPVIFVSASERIEDKVHAFSTGAVDYVTKPYQAEEVLARVATHLSLIMMKRKIETSNVQLAQEIAQRKQIEEQLKSTNSELEAFVYSVSHDLRAPLRHVEGFIKLLVLKESKGLTEDGRRYLDIITRAAIRMGNLIDDLLTLSRTGRAELKSAPLDLNALLSEVIRELPPETTARQIKWEIDSLPMILGDRILFKQAFVNLVTNAAKFTSKRSDAEIRIGILPNSSAVETEVEMTTLFIRDNGVGFDPKYSHKLFGVFQRLHSDEDFEGTGIGLAIVQRIITRHGGRVWAEGEPDKGATFFLTLYRAQP